MPYYVIKRTDQDGGYVTPPGSRRSYTQNIHEARYFKSKEFAEALRCEQNEIVVSISMDDIVYIS